MSPLINMPFHVAFLLASPIMLNLWYCQKKNPRLSLVARLW